MFAIHGIAYIISFLALIRSFKKRLFSRSERCLGPMLQMQNTIDISHSYMQPNEMQFRLHNDNKALLTRYCLNAHQTSRRCHPLSTIVTSNDYAFDNFVNFNRFPHLFQVCHHFAITFPVMASNHCVFHFTYMAQCLPRMLIIGFDNDSQH